MPEKLHTPEGAAKFLGISTRTVKNYLQKGIIKGVKTAMKWRIPESDLQEYIDGLKTERDRHTIGPSHKYNQQEDILKDNKR